MQHRPFGRICQPWNGFSWSHQFGGKSAGGHLTIPKATASKVTRSPHDEKRGSGCPSITQPHAFPLLPSGSDQHFAAESLSNTQDAAAYRLPEASAAFPDMGDADASTNACVDAKGNLDGELRFPLAPPAPGGHAVSVAPGILWARMAMPMALDHINVYLLEDDDGWYALDTGLALDTTKLAWQQLLSRYGNGKPLKGVICTHFHYDHAGLAPWLMQAFDVPLYMTGGEYYFLRAVATSHGPALSQSLTGFYRRLGVPQTVQQQIFDTVSKDPFMGSYPPSFRRLSDGDTLEIGNRQWQVVIGAGHSPEHACLWCADDALLLSGDQLLPKISSNVLVNEIEPEANPLSDWLDSLQRLASLPGDPLVLPAHGPVFYGHRLRAAQISQHHQQQLQLLQQAIVEQGSISVYQGLSILFPRKLGPVETMLALGETLAHLNYLLWQEKIFIQSGADNAADSYCPLSDEFDFVYEPSEDDTA